MQADLAFLLIIVALIAGLLIGVEAVFYLLGDADEDDT